MNSTTLPTLPTLTAALQSATGDSLISQAASNKVLTAAKLNPFILQGMQGPDPTKVRATRVIPAKLIIDNSGSMHPHRDILIKHCNQLLAKVERSTERKSIVLSVDAIESSPRSITNGFRQLRDPKITDPNDPINLQAVQPFTNKDIRCNSGTALYDTVYQSLSSMIAYVSSFSKAGTMGKLVIAVFSDGADQHSQHHTAADVKELMEELRANERAIMVFFGFGPQSVFKGVGIDMGFLDENIVVESSVNDKLLGEKFDFVSSTLISASQGLTVAPPPQSSNSSFVTP